MSPQSIEKLLKSREGDELVAFITTHIKALDRVSGIPDDWDDRAKAVAVSARKLAADTLSKILKPFLEYQEPRESVEEPESDIYHNHLPKIINNNNAKKENE